MKGLEYGMNYIYILRCEDNSLYTGVTKDLYRRMDAHYYGKKEGAKYTKSHRPKEIAMVWTTEQWSDACRLEAFIKTLSKGKKEEIIQKPSMLRLLFQKKKNNEEFWCKSCKNLQIFPIEMKKFLSKCIILC